MRKGLGKGLSALIEEAAQEQEGPSREIEIHLIDPNREQPRHEFDAEKLKELSDSILQYGVVQPIIVAPRNGRYILVAGERRWRASKIAGLKYIPAVVREYTEQEILEISLIENLQRADLNPVEQAMGIARLMEEYQLTQEQTAIKLGKSRPQIANILRLLHLSPVVLEKLRQGELTTGHARALLPLSEQQQERACNQIIKMELSVRQCEALAKKMMEEKKPENEEVIIYRPEGWDDVEDQLRRIMGTKVVITGSEKKGYIRLEYYSADELSGLVDKLLEISRR
ncbi:MAG: ParB/RepB/Spo0J family partition protein [Christensenellales bacterium]